MTNSTIGSSWLTAYGRALTAGDADALAELFHPGIAYIVNGAAREGASALSQKDTWTFIFSRIEFLAADTHNLFEPHPGHIMYHEVLKVRIRATGQVLEGHFGDAAVVGPGGKQLLMNRVADPAYFEAFDKALSASVALAC